MSILIASFSVMALSWSWYLLNYFLYFFLVFRNSYRTFNALK